ncbi:D-tagatose-bisphosphate aldolase, class II, non-catalytic subunit [Shewanella sp. H8]|uniref:D-tagatose-bisphosphate aldolase, class II, non-catalytic subunit n=1 Tax=Shewanella sp. H8 TaxID=3342676 RepID=UPI003314EAD1
MKVLLGLIQQHKMGAQNGLYSVCSSHPLVLEAAMKHALSKGEHVIIEATSNQVNQEGGYTGKTPADFYAMIHMLAGEVGLPLDKVILGGDHLGPNCWQDLPAEEAMVKSDELIACYVRAGFRKIHLDCSMSCADDPVPLGDAIVAERAARLCAIAENTWSEVGGEPPVYVIGTEVPVPGGAQEGLDSLEVTSVEAASETIQVHYDAFMGKGLKNAWQRIIGLVVQPGVEFDHHKIIPFQPAKAQALSQYIESNTHMVFEAHSTDYQSTAHLSALVDGHFAILKVGPWLTFALREAIWALDAIEQEWITAEQRSNVKAILLQAMNDNPVYWKKYYSTEPKQQALDCQYSLSDRIRYYWPVPAVDTALNILIDNLNCTPPPLTLLSQYMPAQYQAVMDNTLSMNVRELIFHKISQVLEQYSIACNKTVEAVNKDI